MIINECSRNTAETFFIAWCELWAKRRKQGDLVGNGNEAKQTFYGGFIELRRVFLRKK